MASLSMDNTTVVLLSLLLIVLLYIRYFNAATPLVHPLLLGKQSEVSSTRAKGQSGIYRSWATGLDTPLTLRPANSLKTVDDIVKTGSKPRCILDHNLSNDSLKTLSKTLAFALPNLFSSLSNPFSPILNLLSPVHSLPILLLSLSRKTAANPLILLASPEHFTAALKPTSSAHAAPGLIVISSEQLEDVVEQVIDDAEQTKVGILVLGAPTDVLPSGASATSVVQLANRQGVAVKFWDEVWSLEDEAEAENQDSLISAVSSDVHSFIYDERAQVLTLTHENLTAGIAGIFSMFPADKRPSTTDVVVSSVPLTEAFGLSLALGCVWSGAGFRLLVEEEDASEARRVEQLTAFVSADPEACRPPPSMLFLTKPYLQTITASLHAAYRVNPLYALAARHKALALHQGTLSRTGFFESLVWRQSRNTVLNGIAGSKLRATVLVSGSLSQAELAQAFLALSTPITRLVKSSVSAGPVTATHFYDLQCDELATSSSSQSEKKGEYESAHVGPPASNAEVRLAFEEEPEENEPVGGTVQVRGPAVLATPGDWATTAYQAVARTNGTFVLV